MSKEKIVFVDDEEMILNTLEQTVSQWAENQDVELVFYSSPEEALSYIKEGENDIALVVSDLTMPGMSGIELLLEIKKIRSDTNSIVLTGYSDLEMVSEAIAAGISAFIFKPWDTQNLLYQIEKALTTYRTLRERNRYVEMLDEELKWAGELQKTLLETEAPRTRKLSFQTTYIPLPNLYCGGDYYDIIHFGEEQFILLIGDVAGHGVKAAFITSIMKTIIYRNYIRIRVGKSFSPADFLTWLNNQLCLELEKFPDMIVTFLTIFVDVNHRSIVYSNAGHLPFYMFNREGKGEWHIESGSAMGFYPDMPYRDNALPLNEGDTVVCITDGLTEHPRSAEPMDYNIIEEIILREAKTNSFHSNVIKAVKSQLKTDELYDDTTLISFRVEKI